MTSGVYNLNGTSETKQIKTDSAEHKVTSDQGILQCQKRNRGTCLVRGDQKELGLFYLAKSRLSVLFIGTFWTRVNLRER